MCNFRAWVWICMHVAWSTRQQNRTLTHGQKKGSKTAHGLLYLANAKQRKQNTHRTIRVYINCLLAVQNESKVRQKKVVEMQDISHKTSTESSIQMMVSALIYIRNSANEARERERARIKMLAQRGTTQQRIC